MARPEKTWPSRLLRFVTALLAARVLVGILANYPSYAPPDFGSEFLHGREGYFGSWYRWAFYAHILSGPASLVLGFVLVSDAARAWSPRWHRRLGWGQVGCILLLVTPSGLAMAWYAAAGTIAAAGLGTLAVATGGSAALGARAARTRRFGDHRRWMWRGHLLLCSAIVLRLMGGLATVAEWYAPWVDPLTAWACWIVPLAAFEGRERWLARGSRSASV